MIHFIHNHQDGLEVIKNDEQLLKIFNELIQILTNINDDILLKYYHKYSPNGKGLSIALNALFRDLLLAADWNKEVRLYVKCDIKGTNQKIDFVHKSGTISIEVSFNNSGSLSGIVGKLQQSVAPHPTIEKNTYAKIGILICGTYDLRKYGGLDGASIDEENGKAYLFVNAHKDDQPLILICLDRPDTFNIEQYQENGKGKKTGKPVPRTD